MIVFIYSICREILFPCRPFHGCIRPINAPVSLSCLQFTPLRRTQEPPTALLCLGRGYQTGHWAPAPFLERWTWPFCFSPSGSKLSVISSHFQMVCVDQTQISVQYHIFLTYIVLKVVDFFPLHLRKWESFVSEGTPVQISC